MNTLKIILFCVCLAPMSMFAQIPVTDAATNSQLAILNQSILTMNLKLSALNTKMATLIKLMERNTTVNSKSSQVLTQDLTAKRKPASYVLGSPEMAELMDLKDKVMEAYKASRQSLNTFEHLKEVENQEAFEMLTNALVQVSSLMSQGMQISSTPEIMESADRLTALSSINEKLSKILEDIMSLNNALMQKNEHRKALYSTIKLN